MDDELGLEYIKQAADTGYIKAIDYLKKLDGEE